MRMYCQSDNTHFASTIPVHEIDEYIITGVTEQQKGVRFIGYLPFLIRM